MSAFDGENLGKDLGNAKIWLDAAQDSDEGFGGGAGSTGGGGAGCGGCLGCFLVMLLLLVTSMPSALAICMS